MRGSVVLEERKKDIKKVSMIRKYHNHTLQTNPQHREEEPRNTNSQQISGILRQLKQSNQLSLPHQDDCITRKDTKYCITKQGPNRNPCPQTMGAEE